MSDFMSRLFQQVIFQLGAKKIKPSAYQPESQGALERFHSTLKNMISTMKTGMKVSAYYCLQTRSQLKTL